MRWASLLGRAAFQKSGGRWGCLVSPVIHANCRNKGRLTISLLNCAIAVPFLKNIACPNS